MSRAPSVAVLVSVGSNPISGVARACHGDAVALAVARKLSGGSMRVIHVGQEQEPALRDYLALGAGVIEVLAAARNDDVSALLAPHVTEASIILTGSRAERGAGSGLLPYMLAELLGRPVINDVIEAHVEGDEIIVQQFMPKGKRRAIASRIPVVLSIHPMAEAQLHYAYARAIAGRIVPILNVANNVRSGERNAPQWWTSEAEPRRPMPLKAQQNLDGHARMLTYVESPARGGVVVFAGTPVDKAQIVLTYLRDHQLIDF